MTLAAWFHSLSPFVIGPIRWYGLSYLAGFVVAYFALVALSKRKLIAIPAERVMDAMMWLVGGVIVGGRLGYVIFYDPALFVTFFDHAPWWGLLAINEGGMASHGGMVGVILASWRVSRGWRDERGEIVGRTSPMHVFDVTALVCPFGLGFGRLANFVNGELLGKIVTPPGVEGPWWAVQYPQELDLPPGQLAQTPADWARIDALAAQVGGGDVQRGLHVLAHEGWKYAEQLKPLVSSRHPSQLYQAAAEGLVLGVALWAIWARPRKPGVVGSWFLIVYGVLRILTEMIRLPDAQLAVQRIAGLSRGQWLSVAMVAVGCVTLVWCFRRAAPKMGGWAKARTGAKRNTESTE